MLHDLIVVAAPALVFVGTVLRMWDSMAEADNSGEFLPRSTSEEMHRFFSFFTLLGRRQEAATADRRLYYLRTAQGWFYLALGSFCALLIAITSVLY